MTVQPIAPALLQWRGQQPYAPAFDDVYFSPDALTEVQRVFVEPCDLFTAPGQGLTTIVELGFGSGLNAAVCVERCLALAGSRLHFISFEAHPLTPQDWQQAAALRPQLQLYRHLAAAPLPLLSGWQRRTLFAGRVTLSVYHGDVVEGLTQLCDEQRTPIQAWFLDGFAPAKNPAMWTAEVCALIARASTPGTCVSTFSAAGLVRRGLTGVGFEMRKLDQLPIKHESLAGVFIGQGTPAATATNRPTVQVHGAGVGGAMVARHLAEQDIEVAVFDPHGIAAGASGIKAAVLHARLLGDGSPSAGLRAAAYHYATACADNWPQHTPNGAMQLLGPNLNPAKLQRIADFYQADSPDQIWLARLDPATVAARLSLPEIGPALWFPQAGAVNIAGWCQWLLDHPNIRFYPSQGQIGADTPQVICAGCASQAFPHCQEMGLISIGGQLDEVQFEGGSIDFAVVGNGYYVPTATGAVIGSTYEHHPWSEAEASDHNMQLNQRYLPAACRQVGRQRGVRCVTSDRLPLVGKVGPNTWLATAFGSMGTTYAPFAAALIASDILGWVRPAQPALSAIVEPQRIARRRAKRQAAKKG